MRTLALLVSWLLVFPTSSSADELLIRGGEVHPIVGDTFEGDVLIRDGIIVGVGNALAAAPDATVIDATGMVVTPGLVEFDTQIGLIEIGAVGQTRDGNSGLRDEIRAGFQVADALNPQSSLIPIARTGGITSVVSRPYGGLLAGQSVWWDLVGDRAEQMIVQSPCTMDLFAGSAGGDSVGGSRATALLRMRELVADISAYLVDPRGFDQGRMRELSVSLVDIQALVPVLNAELPVLMRVSRQADITAWGRWADEAGIRWILANADEAWPLAEELAERGVPVVVDPLRNAPYTFESLGAREDAAAILDNAGVSVIISSGSSHNARLLRQYAGNAVRAGMDYHNALAAISLRPAQAVGLDDRYGSIEIGKIANVVVWTGDPLELSTHARHVIVRGVDTSLRTRQTRLFERYRTLESGRNTAWSPR